MSSGGGMSTLGGGCPSGSGGPGGGGVGGGGGPCGACKFLRRKCVSGCIFAPYFDSEQGAAHFAAVHKVFGASNVSKLLLQIPAHKRLDAVVTICYEAQARLRDPVYGCVAHIFALQQQVLVVIIIRCGSSLIDQQLASIQHLLDRCCMRGVAWVHG
jgi:LOB domain-containing protein 18